MTSPITPTTAEPIVYVVDDDPSVRAALEDLLASVGLRAQCFGATRDFLAHPREPAPGCLVLDVRMPGQSGLDFHRQLSALGIPLPVVFITGHGDMAMAVGAMKAGAIEFLGKPFRDQDLLDAIQNGIARDRQRLAQEDAGAELRARWATLTPGEQEVVRLVVQGQLNKQIAWQLQLSEVTVKVRRGQAMRKMQAPSLAELVRMVDRLSDAG